MPPRPEPAEPPECRAISTRRRAMRRARCRARPPAAPPPAERPGTQPRNRSGGERRSVTDEGLKGFRDVIAEAEALGDATAQGAKTAREVFAATPPTTSQAFDRLEPRVEPEGLRTPMRPLVAAAANRRAFRAARAEPRAASRASPSRVSPSRA